MACAFGRYGYGRKALVVFLCVSISACCKNRAPLCLPLFSLWYSPPLEGGTISRGNCAPSEGEGVSENGATILVCGGRSILLLRKEYEIYAFWAPLRKESEGQSERKQGYNACRLLSRRSTPSEGVGDTGVLSTPSEGVMVAILSGRSDKALPWGTVRSSGGLGGEYSPAHHAGGLVGCLPHQTEGLMRYPPASPPSGPSSMMWSAAAMM